MSGGIHQFVPMLHRGDAVGRHTRRLRDAIVARGLESQIYVEMTDPETAAETALALSYPEACRPGDVLIYQFATASAMAGWLCDRPETLVVNYHNITPPEQFAAWDNHVALGQLRAQDELSGLVARSALAVADSEYNRAHLVEAGFAATAVVPPAAALANMSGPDRVASGGTARHAATANGTGAPHAPGARWLCVGRVAPNKAVQDVIAALLVTRQRHDPEATLTVVGKPAIASYAEALQRFAADLGLSEAVHFVGHVGDATVAAAYAAADVLVVTSIHEGYCVPVVEAMAAGVPVVALRQGAVPEVLGDAGVLVDEVGPDVLASTIAGVVADPALVAALASRGQARLAELDLPGAADRLVDLVMKLR
jgi:glycosyltransferase involved in cell wall biosynthesis